MNWFVIVVLIVCAIAGVGAAIAVRRPAAPKLVQQEVPQLRRKLDVDAELEVLNLGKALWGISKVILFGLLGFALLVLTCSGVLKVVAEMWGLR